MDSTADMLADATKKETGMRVLWFLERERKEDGRDPQIPIKA